MFEMRSLGLGSGFHERVMTGLTPVAIAFQNRGAG